MSDKVLKFHYCNQIKYYIANKLTDKIVNDDVFKIWNEKKFPKSQEIVRKKPNNQVIENHVDYVKHA